MNKVVSDTLIKVSDTIKLNLLNTLELFLGNKELVVKTISEPKLGIEIWGLWIGIIAAIITIIYTFFALRKLLSNDEQLQSQINELVKLNHLFERRLRMTVKPHLFVNGSRNFSIKKQLGIDLWNRGNIAFYTGYKIIDGYKDVTFQEWNKDIEIRSDRPIILSGHSYNKPSEIEFKMQISYYDKENYRYESIIHWDKGSASLIETKEL